MVGIVLGEMNRFRGGLYLSEQADILLGEAKKGLCDLTTFGELPSD
jgi:hypothetical protein